jgi:hypothetical protein
VHITTQLGRIDAHVRLSPEHQEENEVARIEQLELEGHRSNIIADVKKLVEKYCAICDWDVSETDSSTAIIDCRTSIP